MEHFEDLSVFPDGLNEDHQEMFDSINNNDMIEFPTVYQSEKMDFNNHVDAFFTHEMKTHEFISDGPNHNGLFNDHSFSSFQDEFESSHNNTHLGQTTFTGIYNDAEIEKMKDNVEHYQYVVDTLNSKVNTLREIADLAQRNNSFNAECKEDQLRDAISEYNNALSDLKEAKVKLNNAT